MVDWSRTLLLWDTKDKELFGLDPYAFEASGMPTLEIDYSKIGQDERIIDKIKEKNPRAVIFTRNDDMEGNPPIGDLLQQLRVGYTSISAIDLEFQVDQTRICIQDCLSRTGIIDLPEFPNKKDSSKTATGTFSLIFDLEQFGGARFGVPRLLPIIESKSIRATFFVTGFIAEVYPELLQRILAGGHEIGVHGAMHEFLQGRSLDQQVSLIHSQKKFLNQYGVVQGANFIFRMDEFSPEAFALSGLTYFVHFRKNLFYRTRFIEASSQIRNFRTATGDIMLVPVGVETYGLQRAEIEGTINTAWRFSKKEGVKHISVLMHPFKDGTLKRLNQTRRVIQYLVDGLGLKPLPLAEVPACSESKEYEFGVHCEWSEFQTTSSEMQKHKQVIRKLWWIPQVYYLKRIENLTHGLEKQGHRVALCANNANIDKLVSVYPDSSNSENYLLFSDPIIDSQKTAAAVVKIAETHARLTVHPPQVWRDILNFLLFHFPRSFLDLKILFNRLMIKSIKLFHKLCTGVFQ